VGSLQLMLQLLVSTPALDMRRPPPPLDLPARTRPMANFMLSAMGAFAGFERSLIRERQKEGIALAKQRRLREAIKVPDAGAGGRAGPAGWQRISKVVPARD
jgi:hypothetical protein